MGKLRGMDCNGCPDDEYKVKGKVGKKHYVHVQPNHTGKSVTSQILMEQMIKSGKYEVTSKNHVVTFRRKETLYPYG